MDKKQFDHIEQQMKTAADSWEPAFDQKAWEQMEKMLEGENDRKRPVAWWSWLVLLLAVLITGGYLLLRNNTIDNQKKSPEENIALASTITQTDLSTIVLPADKKDQDNTVTPSALQMKSANSFSNRSTKPYKRLSRITGTSIADDEDLFPEKNFTGDAKGKTVMNVSAGQTGENDNAEMINEAEPNTTGEKEEITTMPKENLSLVTEEKKKETSTEKVKDTITKNKTEKENKKDKQPSKFYFSVATGVEGNGVDFPGMNKFSTRAGFTVGYQLTKRLSLQIGFFAGSKKYVAGKGDYKAKGGYWATVDITKVEADCRVFEIPLALQYDFSPTTKWNLFAGAGLSSYIMDNEAYAYDYIRAGNPYYAKASYTGNQHLFAVVRLSGGVERKISPQFSLGLHPGLAIPLAGAGEGQIKLFSTEILFSLRYRPFKRSK